MNKTIRFLIIILAVSILNIPAIGFAGQSDMHRDEPSAGEPAAMETSDDSAEPAAGEEAELSDYDALIQDLEVIEGLFTFYRDEESGTVYMKIMPEQLDVIHLLSPTMESGTGEKGLWGAMMYYEMPIVFHEEPGMVQLIKINTNFRADDEGIKKVLGKMYSDSFISDAAIEAENDDTGEILIDAASVFLGDIVGLNSEIDYWPDMTNSKLGVIKAFPKNVNISAILAYATDRPAPTMTLPDPRSMRIEFRYDISERPDTGYKPRYEDGRVGYFTTTFMDYTDDSDPERFKYYINRWHLEKKNPHMMVSEPVEPIVFWLENTIPQKYRPALTEGILMWNKAFERVGFKNAVVVKEMPDDADWDPADVRYSTIRWYAATDASFAIGPCRADPFTGEIYDADIGVSIDIPRYNYLNFLQTVGILEDMDNSLLSGNRFDPVAEMKLAEVSMMQNMFGLDVLKANGMIEPCSDAEEEYVMASLKTLICHEVGHTLGLRHNFKGTSGIPTDKLHDKAYTSIHGTSCSVMDYDVPNIAPPGVEQGDYFSTTVGDYDLWAIEYGYTDLAAETPEDEVPALMEIASRGANPLTPYGTDQDAHMGTFSMDPECIAWDMGSDVFAYYDGTLANMRKVFSKLETYWDKPGTDYKWLRNSYMASFFEYWMAGRTIKRYVGGIIHNRYKVGDPDGAPPYVPVDGKIQRKALKFLSDNIWGEDAFQFDTELINKLEVEREAGFDYSVYASPHDFAVHSQVLLMQGHTLTWLYDPVVITRLHDMEYKYPWDAEPFYLEDMFVFVRDAIWDEVFDGRNINSFRRNLQQFHLDILIRIVVDPAPGTPDDARALARMDLTEISIAIDKALLGENLDYMTNAHLAEVASRINAALYPLFQYPGYNQPWAY